jgi:ubiquinone/menaquinone biosynthesis C-methylase UbiE
LFFSYLSALFFFNFAPLWPLSPFQRLFSTPVTTTGADFDRVARWYDALASLVFGSAQRDAQRAALAGLPPGAPHVLILGGGSGWVLEEVLRRRPAATILYLDASAVMLAQAEARLHRRWPAQRPQVVFRWGTETALAAGEKFDAVLTFFVLDCMTPAVFAAAVMRLAAALRPAAPWLIAEFAPPRRWWQHGLLWTMYLFFRLTAGLAARQLPDYAAALARQGLWAQQANLYFGGAITGAIFSSTVPEASKK